MLDKTTKDWSSEAAALQIEGRAFIDGQYRDALSGETRTTISPANGQDLADVAVCGTEDAARAAVVARGAFGGGPRRPGWLQCSDSVRSRSGGCIGGRCYIYGEGEVSLLRANALG